LTAIPLRVPRYDRVISVKRQTVLTGFLTAKRSRRNIRIIENIDRHVFLRKTRRAYSGGQTLLPELTKIRFLDFSVRKL